MINSANTINFGFSKSDRPDLSSPKMMPADKFKTSHVSSIPSNDVVFVSPYTEPFSQYVPVYTTRSNNHTTETKAIETSKSDNTISSSRERVKVQHLQTHTKLQNNHWNYRSFHSLSATDMEKETPNNYKPTPNECAFNKCYDTPIYAPVLAFENPAGDDCESNNNNNSNNNQKSVNPSNSDNCGNASDRRTSPIQRTEDQENAFRRIEDVHNYAKLNTFSYSNESSTSSVHDDDEEEDEEDADGYGEHAAIDERYYGHRSHIMATAKAKMLGRSKPSRDQNNVKNEELDTHVDVESVRRAVDDTDVSATTPDHHARRPMNAFLIFCKRHRAIVKERYKSLENRAITKILGDWWASLDQNEKICFTNLAQKNKDAFFSANPNFKWYKLPAPPLRTLNTRPSNVERIVEVEMGYDSARSLDTTNIARKGNIFKLADEAQMGELSTLMSTDNQCALQQALGETTQFLSAHMPHTAVHANNYMRSDKVGKRRLHSDNSLSGNSSEEDVVPKKSSRSCKGKIYQELKNSGQIAVIAKKLKAPKVQGRFQQGEQNDFVWSETLTAGPERGYENSFIPSTIAAGTEGQYNSSPRTVPETGIQHYDINNFDLEEKIKELPALNLDTYLQRKRNTKKKKKFSKKRNSNSTSSNKSSISTTVPSPPVTPPKEIREPPQQPVAVGSQKRKARKESITRRDISAIENEIASVIPLATDFTAINGCYYFNQSAVSKTTTASVPKPATEVASKHAPDASATAFHQVVSNVAPYSDFNENISPTSDLLILAEVAANRTELTK